MQYLQLSGCYTLYHNLRFRDNLFCINNKQYAEEF